MNPSIPYTFLKQYVSLFHLNNQLLLYQII